MKKILIFLLLPLLFSLTTRLNIKVFAQAPIGNYIELKGGYLKTQSFDTSSPQAFTFEAWIKPDSVSGIQKILSIGDKTANTLHYEIGINGGSFSLTYKYATYSFKFITAGAIQPNIWNHVALTISSAETKLYLDGKTIFSTSGAANLLPLGKNIVIGGSFLESSGNNFKGAIDEVRISTINRDVGLLWNSGTYNNSLIINTDTYALWRMDEPRGVNQAFDISDNMLDLDLIGGDNLIHFFGVLPSPTPTPTFPMFSLPTLGWKRPVLPTLRIPMIIQPTPVTISPTLPITIPSPTSILNSRPVWDRSGRP